MARNFWVTFSILFSCASISFSADYSSLVVFGDSLSDVGNINNATFGLQPGSEYFDGRFSNGPVYSELLADRLGLGPLLATTDGGTNYAFGGGRTSGTSFFEGGFFIRDLDDQVDDFLDDSQVDEEALYVVFAGSNDFVLGNVSDAIGTAQRVEQQTRRLASAGIRNLLSINLPQLGHTPRFADNQQVMNDRIAEFNEELEAGVDRIESEFTELNVVRYDLEEIFNQVIELPVAFGFSNITDQGIQAANADGFVFWDDVHPTKDTHVILANAIYSQFNSETLIGDFNYNEELDVRDVDLLAFTITNNSDSERLDLTEDGELDQQDVDAWLSNANSLNGDSDLSGEVDFADFLKLSRNFGTTDEVLWSSGDFDADGQVAFTDFLILSRNFGESVAVVAVPEPNLSVALAFILALLVRHAGDLISSRPISAIR